MRRTAAGAVEPTECVERMNVDWHALSAGLTRDLLEKIILQRLVLRVRRGAAHDVLRVDPSRLGGTRVAKIEWPEIRRLEFHRHGALSMLPNDRRPQYVRDVGIERRRKSREIQLAKISTQQRLLFRIETPRVWRASSFGACVEWKEGGIIERDPPKARRHQARADGDSVGEHDVDARAIQDPRGIILA